MVLLEASFCIAISEKLGKFSYKNRENYGFKYEVNAPETGDRKHHSETHANGHVLGSYSITEPNGAHRYVKYVANSKGFNAIVRQEYRFPGIYKHPTNTNEIHQAEGTTATSALTSKTEIPITTTTARYSYRHNLKMNEFFRRNRNQVELSEKRRKEFEKLLQNREFIQSSPRVSTLHYLQPKPSQQIGLSQPNERNVRNRQQQYEVTEPDPDFIDIRRSVDSQFY